MKNCKEVYLRCTDHAETIQFTKFEWKDGSADYELNVLDSYCGYDLMGIKNRFKRAWKAFWAKPVCYTGVYCDDKEKMKRFLSDCLYIVEEENET